jgi:hypothetical protein
MDASGVFGRPTDNEEKLQTVQADAILKLLLISRTGAGAESAAAPQPDTPGEEKASRVDGDTTVPPERSEERSNAKSIDGAAPTSGESGNSLFVVEWVRIEGRLDLSFQRISKLLVFSYCSFPNDVTFEGAIIDGLSFYHCKISESLVMSWSQIDGDLRLIDTEVSKDVVLDWSQIHGDLRLIEVKVPKSEDGQHKVSTINASVGGRINLSKPSVLSDDVVDTLVGSAGRLARDSAPGTRRIGWDHALQVAGLGAGLAAWVAVVGGARLWARMVAIDAPALPTLASLGQGWMVAEGLQTLLVPILLGGAVSLLVYYSRLRPRLWATAGASPPTPSRNTVQTGAGVATSGNSSSSGRARTASGRHNRQVKNWALYRTLPLTAIQRLYNKREGFGFFVSLAVLTGLLGAGLLVARASWQVLATTILILILGSASALIGMDGWRLTGIVAATLVAVGLVWWFGSDASWIVVVVMSVIASVLVWLIGVVPKWAEGPWALPALLGAVAVLGVCLSMVATVRVSSLLIMGAVTVLALWVTLGAIVDKTPQAAAVTVFIAIVAWSGALGYAREIGDRTPDLPLARVDLRGGGNVGGYFLGRSSSDLFLAQDPPLQSSERRHAGRHVMSLALADVSRVVIGRTVVLPDLDADQGSDTSSTIQKTLGIDKDPDSGAPRGGGAGTQGNPPDKDTRTDDPVDQHVDQPRYVPRTQPPFDDRRALARLDETVSGVPVRLELLSLVRNDDVLHLDMRIINMSGSPHPLDRMLSLDGRTDFDIPRLTDARRHRVYQVSRLGAVCDCSQNLQQISLGPFQSCHVWAVFDAPGANRSLDLTVPGFGTFRDVKVT